jgi:hypothetical protein
MWMSNVSFFEGLSKIRLTGEIRDYQKDNKN